MGQRLGGSSATLLEPREPRERVRSRPLEGGASALSFSVAPPRPASASAYAPAQGAAAPRRPVTPVTPVTPVASAAQVGPARAASRSRVSDLPWVLAIASIAALALVLRLINHSTNYDVFIDEITYATIGQAVALGHGASLYGTPFFLHPPAFFYLEAGVLDLFGGAHRATIGLVLALRPINCVIGAIDCALIMVLVSRFANRPAAIVTGMFMACDPFLLLWDGRVLLETMAMTTAVAGWLCLEWFARREATGAQRGTRAERRMVVLGGLLFGASLLTKETYAFVGVVPLAAMLVIGSPVSRRVSGAMLALAMGCYGVFLATVVVAGNGSEWLTQQTAGFARAVGTKQITGFNQSGHHAGFGSRVGANLSLFLFSYLVILMIAAATAFGVWRWFRAARAARSGRPASALTPQRRLGIVLGAGGVGYVGYAVVLGAFEVQIFYMCVVAGLPVLATELLASWPGLRARLRSRRVLVACAVLASLALVFDLTADVRLRTQTDSDLPELVSYVSHHVPSLSLVDSTDGVSQFVLQGVRIDGPLTVRGVERDRPGYVVVDAGLVNEGYVTLGSGFQSWLDRNADVVFSVTGRSTGRILLYRTVYATGAGQ